MEDQTHLTENEIIEFVSLDQLTDDSKKLLTRVNKHIRKCKKCFELVKSYQILYDEMNSRIKQQTTSENHIFKQAGMKRELNRINNEYGRALRRARRGMADPKAKKSYN